MATARARRDSRGNLYLYLSGQVDGARVEVRKRVQDDDQELADRAVAAHAARFLVGDLSELIKARDDRAVGRRPSARRRTRQSRNTLGTWSETWIESIRGTTGEGAWRTCRSTVRRAVDLLGSDRALESFLPGDLVIFRADLLRSGLAEVTVARKIAETRRLFAAAVLSGKLEANPFVETIRVRRTKRQRAAARESTDTSLPLSPAELERFLKVCRAPRLDRPREVHWFPLSEALALTGLRYGEVAGLRWPEVDRAGGCVRICHALEHHSPDPLAPTKTGASWTIPLRAPLRALLDRQRERVFLRDPEGYVFPTERGRPASYRNWRNRVWPTLLLRSKISLGGSGDAQKLLRKLFITSALVCGRNPKLVSSEVGHANLRMITDYYERFIDPANWPDVDQTRKLVKLYGFEDVQVVAVTKGKGATG